MCILGDVVQPTESHINSWIKNTFRMFFSVCMVFSLARAAIQIGYMRYVAQIFPFSRPWHPSHHRDAFDFLRLPPPFPQNVRVFRNLDVCVLLSVPKASLSALAQTNHFNNNAGIYCTIRSSDTRGYSIWCMNFCGLPISLLRLLCGSTLNAQSINMRIYGLSIRYCA